jgi:hypothetical protein
MECEIRTVEQGEISAFLKSLCAEKPTGIILPAPAAAMLGWRSIETITDVLKSCRVALIDGAMEFPLANDRPRAEVDLVAVAWRPAAKLIVAELLNGKAFLESGTTALQARAHLRVGLPE